MFDRKLLTTCVLTSSLIVPVATAQASDHLDAPNVVNNGQIDVNDLYAFKSPTNPNNTVLIQTVNPFAGQSEPDFFNDNRPPSPTKFGTNVDYSIRIDNNGDARPDVTYTTTFASRAGGGQSLTTTRRAGGTSSTVAQGRTGSQLSTNSGGKVQAGLFDDPFFFDEKGFKNNFNFTGKDSFAGANVSAIVLEVPTSELGGKQVGIEATTSKNGMQIDRVGRPAINTALIPKGQKSDFNISDPKNDVANFRDEVVASINALPGDADAQALADILLPDLLTYDATKPSGFLNGRKLTDDVIDAELALLTNGAATSDGVDANDVAFRGLFPYLARPNQLSATVPTPSAAFAGLSMLGLIVLRRKQRRA